MEVRCSDVGDNEFSSFNNRAQSLRIKCVIGRRFIGGACLGTLLLVSAAAPDANAPRIYLDPTRLTHFSTLEGHASDVLSLAVSRDSQRLATGDKDGNVKVWDLRTRQCVRTIPAHTGGGRVVSLDFSPARRILVSGSTDGTARIWDLGTGQRIATIRGWSVTHMPVRFSPDGRKLLYRKGKGVVGIWDVQGRAEAGELLGHGGDLLSVAWSRDGKKIASTTNAGELKVWDAKTRRELAGAAPGELPLSVAWSPDMKWIVTADTGSRVKVFQSADLEPVKILEGHGHQATWAEFTNSGGHVLSVDAKGALIVWDTRKWKSIREMSAHAGNVKQLLVTPNSRFVVTCSSDRTIKLWSDRGR